jgi:hypothetical protein
MGGVNWRLSEKSGDDWRDLAMRQDALAASDGLNALRDSVLYRLDLCGRHVDRVLGAATVHEPKGSSIVSRHDRLRINNAVRLGKEERQRNVGVLAYQPPKATVSAEGVSQDE